MTAIGTHFQEVDEPVAKVLSLVPANHEVLQNDDLNKP